MVQTYLVAVTEGHAESAADLLARTGSCTATDLARTSGQAGFRADLAGQQVEHDVATVQVRITSASNDPFGSGWQGPSRSS